MGQSGPNVRLAHGALNYRMLTIEYTALGPRITPPPPDGPRSTTVFTILTHDTICLRTTWSLVGWLAIISLHLKGVV